MTSPSMPVAERRGGGPTAAPPDEPARKGIRPLLAMAGPFVASRAGLAMMGVVNAIMVAHVSADELAAVSLSEGTFGRVLEVCTAFVASGLVLFARTRRGSDQAIRGALWRRLILSALVLGLIIMVLASFAGPLLHLMVQNPVLVERSAHIINILAPGVPFGLMAIACAVVLEGSGHARAVAFWVIAANLLNVIVDYMLVGGRAGFPQMGAAGAAVATDIVRIGLFAGLAGTLLRIEGMRGLFASKSEPAPISAERSRDQLSLGLSASATSGGLHIMGSLLTLFAGWLGSLDLAAWTSGWIINLPGMLLALGLGDALSLRAARAASPKACFRLIFSDLGSIFLLTMPLGAVILLLAGPIALAYTSDPALSAKMAGLLPLSGLVLVLDSLALGMISALRTLRDIRSLVFFQIVTMVATPLLAAMLGFGAGPVSAWGAQGMVAAVLLTSAVRALTCLARLFALAAQVQKQI